MVLTHIWGRDEPMSARSYRGYDIEAHPGARSGRTPLHRAVRVWRPGTSRLYEGPVFMAWNETDAERWIDQAVAPAAAFLVRERKGDDGKG